MEIQGGIQSLRRSARPRASTLCQVERCSRGPGSHMAHLWQELAFAAPASVIKDPTSFEEAMTSPYAEQWKAAMREEIKCFKKASRT